MTDHRPIEEPEELSDFDRLMRGLVGVDPGELTGKEIKMTDERYLEIDGDIQGFGWVYNPDSEAFEATRGDERDNSLSVEWKQLLETLDGVTEEELREYCARKDADHQTE